MTDKTVRESGAPRRALIVHGAGSTSQFVQRVFGPALAAHGYVVVGWDQRRLAEDADHMAELERLAADATVVGGVSYGAHLAARWAVAGGRPQRLLFALPAWLGTPSGAAALTAAAAAEIAAHGIEETLRRVERDAPAWVAVEMRDAWATYDDRSLTHALQTAAQAPAPTRDELQRIEMPCVVVGMHDDPFHPIDVARQWADALPNAVLVEITYDDGALRPDFGSAAVAALALNGSR